MGFPNPFNPRAVIGSGGGTLTGVLLLPDGTAAAPALGFASDIDVGFYHDDAQNRVHGVFGGTKIFGFDANSIFSGPITTGTFRIDAISVASVDTPVYAFIGDANTGIGRAAADELSLVAGGTGRLLVTSSGIKIGALGTAPDGSGLHIETGSAGAVTAHESADELVLEGIGPTGLSILAADNSRSEINFGAPAGNQRGRIVYSNTQESMAFHTDNSLSFTITSAHELLMSPESGSTLNIRKTTTTMALSSGSSVTATNLIPAGSFILGVTVRVTTAITGASAFTIGDGSDVDRWGTGIAIDVGTTTDITDFTATGFGQFATANDVVLTATTADFTAGAVRLVVHYLDLTAPTS